MRILLLLFLTTVSFAQSKVFRAENIIEYDSTETIRVSDGMVYKWTIPDNTTARFFEAVDGEYEMILTAKKKITDIKIEAETARIVERAQLDQGTGGNTICCVTGTALTNTRLIFDGEKDTGNRKLIVFNYARGNTGKGKIVVSFTKNGVVNSHTFHLDPTGTNVWNVWKEATFDLPPNQVGIMSISTDQPGAWNLDWLTIK